MSTGPGPLAEDGASEEAREGYAQRLTRPGGLPSLSQVSERAADLLGAGSAQVSLISDVHTVMGGAGAATDTVGDEGHPSDSLCLLTVTGAAPLLIGDARRDARVAHLPPVAAGRVGSCLSVPVVASGLAVGALCVTDDEPRTWTPENVALLEILAGQAAAELELAALGAEYDEERVAWQLAVDAAGVGAFDWNLVTRELRWDERLLELFGTDRSTFGGTIEAFDTLVHPEDRSRVNRALREAVSTCGTFAAEYRVLIPDGGTRWVSARGRALAGPEGTAVRLLGAAIDTTAVQAGEALVSRVLEAMPTAFYHVDPAWRFTYLNTEAERLLDATEADVVGRVVWDLFPATVGSDFEQYYRLAVERGRPVTFEAYYPPPLDSWYEVRAWPTSDGLSVYFLDATDRHRAQEAVAHAARRAELLGNVTSALTDTFDPTEAVARLAQLIVPHVADWCLVTLVEEPGITLHPEWRRGLRDVGWWHEDPELRPLVERYTQVRIPALTDASVVARALNGERSVAIAKRAADKIAQVLVPGEARDLCLRLNPSSALVIPLRARGRTLGLLSAFRDPARPAFDPDDIATLEEAAGRAGLALDNARLYVQQRELAETLQRSMMTAPPQPDHLEVAVRYASAAEAAQVGGDWYDAFLQAEGSTMIVIGDVVGHDTAAAAAMGQLRNLLRGIAVTTGAGPAEVLRRVDEAISLLQIDTTATVLVARLEQTAEEREQGVTRLRWSNAGHPPPMIVEHPETLDAPAGQAQVLWATSPDLLLGLNPRAERGEAVHVLPRGSTVLLYTDGLVERRGQSLDEGIERLAAVLTELVDADLTLDEICNALLLRMLPDQPEDDVALVAVRLHREDQPRPPEAGPRDEPDLSL
ncbi:SpoIIE family protein phosphatase [Nocardioides pacificus]